VKNPPQIHSLPLTWAANIGTGSSKCASSAPPGGFSASRECACQCLISASIMTTSGTVSTVTKAMSSRMGSVCLVPLRAPLTWGAKFGTGKPRYACSAPNDGHSTKKDSTVFQCQTNAKNTIKRESVRHAIKDLTSMKAYASYKIHQPMKLKI
jgi:hypothetical protein